ISAPGLFDEPECGDTAMGVKDSEPWLPVAAYRRLAAKADYPLRLGVTEAELVAAGCGVASRQLGGTAQALFRDLGTLGSVMA
ncbi:hypothetical protein LAN33_26225, partial [Mycobacterium tuberculosis]|nr:hypothetical protein [Mycobacterium tuberculosis]